MPAHAPPSVLRVAVIRFAAMQDRVDETLIRGPDTLGDHVAGFEVVVPEQDQSKQQLAVGRGQPGWPQQTGESLAHRLFREGARPRRWAEVGWLAGGKQGLGRFKDFQVRHSPKLRLRVTPAEGFSSEQIRGGCVDIAVLASTGWGRQDSWPLRRWED